MLEYYVSIFYALENIYIQYYIISCKSDIICPVQTRIDQAPSIPTDIVFTIVDGTHGDIDKGFHGKAIFRMKDRSECPCSSIDYSYLLPKRSIAKYERDISVPCEFMEFISVSHYGACGYQAFAKAIGLNKPDAWKIIF